MNDGFERNTAHHIRLLVDHVPSMLAYWDRDLRCRFANRAYERWFGVDPDGLIGTSLQDLLGPSLFAANELYIRAALRGEQQVFERVLPGPDGVRRHSLATYVPELVDGEVMGFVAHVVEVTLLKETEAALREQIAQSERAHSLLNTHKTALKEAQRLGQIGSWEWEVAPDITSWSEELYRIFGRDPKRLPPSFAEHPSLYTPASWARLQAAVARALETGAPYTLELEYLGPNGKSGWIEARGEAVRDEQGAVRMLRGTVLEITMRRLAEDARIRLQVAESADRNKTALMSRVSHELRTPLNGILGFAQLFQADPSLLPTHRQWAEAILASGEHMLELVDEVLDLSAASSGQMAFVSMDLDVAALLRGCVLRFSPVAQASGIALSGPRDDLVLAVRADPKRLRQVIDNLLSNSIKYSRRGASVTVSAEGRGHRMALIVEDTGIGLSADQLARLFVPFERLGAERTEVPGTGVGLALTKEMVERMGGRIEVSSQVGVGSTFTVTLPMAR